MVRDVHQQRDERGAKFVCQPVCVALLPHTSKDFESACDEHFDCAPPDSSGGSGYHHTPIGRHLQPSWLRMYGYSIHHLQRTSMPGWPGPGPAFHWAEAFVSAECYDPSVSESIIYCGGEN